MRKQITASAFVAALLLLGATQYAGAAPMVLTSNTMSPHPWGDNTVGSNATNTPDIGLLWGPTRDTNGSQWGDAGSDGFNMEVDNPLYITFTPDAAYAVKIESFDLRATWPDCPPVTNVVTWTIKDSSSTTLASGVWTVTDYVPVVVSPNLTGALGEPLTLTFNRDAGESWGWAANNITFSQTPEPATLALLAFGGLAVIRRRRVRKA